MEDEQLYIFVNDTTIYVITNRHVSDYIKQNAVKIFSTEDLSQAINYARNILNGREIIVRI